MERNEYGKDLTRRETLLYYREEYLDLCTLPIINDISKKKNENPSPLEGEIRVRGSL
jgi:hypothetical protein